MKIPPPPVSLLRVFALVAMAWPIGLFAQTTTTWSGGGGDNNWGTGANWAGSPPPVGTTSDLVFAGSTRTNPFNNYTAFDDFRNILFASGAGTFSITGNAIDLFGKIENNSTNVQTFALDLGTGTVSGGFIEINPVSGNLNINSTNIFLGNNQLRVWGNNGNTLTFGASTIIQGAGATVAINQNSTVIYQSAHTYIGDTFINAGVLRFASGGSANSSTIRLGDTTGTNVAALQVASGVTLTNGSIEVRSGSSGAKTIAYTDGSGTGTIGRSISLNSSAAADVASGGTLQVTGAITGASTNSFTKTGGGTLTLAGSNTYSGATTISNGTLRAGSTNGLSTNSAFSVASGALLDLGGFNNTIKSLAGPGTIGNSTGTATLRIADALTGTLNTNLFTGTLGLQIYGGGTLNSILGNASNNYSGGTILGLGSGATFTRWFGSGTIGSGSPGAVTNGIFGTGAITIGAATTDRSQIFFLGTTTINNDLVVNSSTGGGVTEIGAFRVESINNLIAGAINANLADATFNAVSAASRTITVSGAISGASGLRVTAQGVGGLTVTLSNTGTANSYAGNTTIDGNGNAVLALGAANQIANGAGKGNLVMSNARFDMRGFSETINGLSGTGTVDGVSGTPTLTVGDNNATSTFSGNIVNTAGALALTKVGTGTLTLAGTNTYSGATTISNGLLRAGSSNGLSTNSAFSVAAGAVMDLGGFNNTIKSLTASGGTITNSTGSATLRVADALSSTLTTNLFTGGLGLQIYGGGSINAILGNASNNYTGGTILGNGSGVATTRWFGSGTVGSGSPGAVTNGIFGTGAITIGAAITDRSQLYFAAATTINNDIVVNSAAGAAPTEIGAFRAESAGNVIAGAINANLADATFNAMNATGRTITVTGAISGTSGVRVTAQSAGGLTVTLSNTGTANSYAGDTTIDGNGNAVLALGAANQIANGAGKGNLVMSNARFDMRGFSETINGLSGTGTVDGVSGTPTLTVGDNNATSTFSGVLQNTAGTLGLAKTGTGTLTLAGASANTYAGATTITNGTLVLNKTAGVNAISGSSVAVGTGATLLISASNQVTNTATVSLSGGTIAKGGGAISETFGALSLGATSFLDFGAGTGNFTFASYAPGGFQLTLQNFNLGNSLTVTTGSFTASEFDFGGFDYTFSGVPSGGFTITAVPEPSTMAAAAGLAGLLAWPIMRRRSWRRRVSAKSH